ncbi:MAG: hypothetical protein I3270_01695 [Candidatus Moeniiplasma glomeromycotorum]|nr:hypothetical protein [Candidatus Moeniiplasma glomeromycotorum]MCE8162420.1 hypothetical protein [Candidatus Moeniiplasma glomeromycotorum]MCE8166346.1 hypothetical protein [Candidatus Moeniiplasma glomeromycotorum]MCE8166828.1 hypothetical protein [Candidatus Moeniiplasma glomeromycotorum]
MRIIQNLPCKEYSPSELKKHCFSHGFCRTEFTRTTTYKEKEIGFCSEVCELSFYDFRFVDRHNLYDVKY